MSAKARLVRFSVFEVDLDSRELFKQGRKVRLQGQPFDLLLAVLERPGEVVTREELREKVWPSDTTVNFDSGLNRAINKLRDALADSARNPQFVETLPRHGYRFIGVIQEENGKQPAPAEAVANDLPLQALVSQPNGPKRRTRERTPLILIASTAFASASIFIGNKWIVQRSTPDLKVRQLTTNSFENPVSKAVISPDGKYLVYSDFTGMRLQEISTGQTHALPKTETLSNDDAWIPAAWSPDGARIVASAIRTTPDGDLIDSIWLIPLLGGNPVLLRDDAIAQAISPDGSLIAFTRNRGMDGPSGARDIPWSSELWVMGPNGEDARKLFSKDGKLFFHNVQWAPDSKRLAFSGMRFDSKSPDAPAIETIPLKGGPPSVVLPNFSPVGHFCWVPDGRIIYTRAEAAPNNRDTNLWGLKVDSSTGRVQGRSHRLTNLPGFAMSNISVSTDGKKVTVQNNSSRSDVYIGRLQTSGQLEALRRLTSDERSNLPFAWTLDSKSVIFTSDRTGVNAIYRQEVDQDLAEMIPTGPERVWSPRVAPDGSSIIYIAEQNILFPWESSTVRVMRVPLAGGPRKVLMEFPTTDYNLDCPTDPAAQCVVEERPSGTRHSRVFAFDPLTGKRRELVHRYGSSTGFHEWTISPDGSHIAEVNRDTIEISSLAGQLEQTIHVKGWHHLTTLTWTADGEAFLVSDDGLTRSTLLRVASGGQTQPLWEMSHLLGTWAVTSPDGRYAAIMRSSQNSNAWLLENF